MERDSGLHGGCGALKACGRCSAKSGGPCASPYHFTPSPPRRLFLLNHLWVDCDGHELYNIYN